MYFRILSAEYTNETKCSRDVSRVSTTLEELSGGFNPLGPLPVFAF